MHPCLDQYNADKAIDGNGGMRRVRGAAAITASRPTPEGPKIEGKWRRKAIFFPSERSWVTLARARHSITPRRAAPSEWS
jgi:hypothetical protein